VVGRRSDVHGLLGGVGGVTVVSGCSEIFLDKVIVAQLIEKFPALMEPEESLPYL
jgi:hypothetical protein